MILLQLVEALEVMILSILSAALKCEWNLSSVQEATITTVTILITWPVCFMCMQVVFFGFLIGNPVWGTVADKYGRKKVNKCKRMCVCVCVCVCVRARACMCVYPCLYLPHVYCCSQALLGTLCWGFVFSIVSAFSSGYYTLLLFRGLVGFGFGGGFLGWVYSICNPTLTRTCCMHINYNVWGEPDITGHFTCT